MTDPLGGRRLYRSGELALLLAELRREEAPYRIEPAKFGEWCGPGCRMPRADGSRTDCCPQCHDERNPRLRDWVGVRGHRATAV